MPSIFGGSGLDFRRFSEDFFELLGQLLAFSLAAWALGLEGRRLPQIRPLKLARILSYGTLANNLG